MKYYEHKWSVQKVSRILNFRGLCTFDFRFFVALCWYSYTSLMPTSSGNLNVLLIFHSYFLGRVLARFRFLSIPKIKSKNSY